MRIQQASTPRADVSKNRHIFHKKSITFETVQKKKRRRKPGTVALQQIKHYQSTTDLLLRLAPFARLVKEIGEEIKFSDESAFSRYKWQVAAIECLQWAAEQYMVATFEDMNKAAIHGKRVTVRPEDLCLVRDIRGRDNPSER